MARSQEYLLPIRAGALVLTGIYTGLVSLSALSWSGGSGHHVRGVLEFPALMPEGSPLLQGPKTLKLTMRAMDAQERIFVWVVP
jgi:hypothetical protein